MHNKSALSEIILLATLKGDVIQHDEYHDTTSHSISRYNFHFRLHRDLITLQYRKDGDVLTFTTCQLHTGASITPLTMHSLSKLLRV